MIRSIIGALVGRELDRRDGRGGLKGAAIGALAMGGLRRMGPLGLVIGAGYVAKKALDRRRAAREGLPALPAPDRVIGRDQHDHVEHEVVANRPQRD